MATLPQLIEEDILQIETAMCELLKQSEATTALIADQGGFLIASQGNTQDYDLTTIAALASGSFLASQSIASLVQETEFNSTYQQGVNFSLYVQSVDESCMLLVVFPATVGVGAVKYFSSPACKTIAKQMRLAQQRDPSGGLDLSILNVADTAGFFKKRD